MIDVARLVGVSAQTVSRVLNDGEAVGPELTERVLNAIKLLGYKRNPAARTLATRRSLNLGILSFGISLYGPSATLFGIVEAARQVGYTTSLVALADYDHASVRAALDHLVEISIDGVIAVAPVREAMEVIRGQLGELPFVAFEPGLADGITRVAVDEVLGARLATRHLLELGHPTVWHVSGPPGWHGTDARIKGWQDELMAARRVAHPLIVGEDWSATAGYQAGKQIAQNREITALFVANDQMSLGLLYALHELGRRVPQDVSVVGFDDIPEAAHFRPALTTVRLDFDAVGRRSVVMLMKKIKAKTSGISDVPLPQLVIRSSSAGPPD